MIPCATLALLLAMPVWAIVITTGDPNSSVYTVGYQDSVGGVNLSGVVQVTSSIGGCTGSLLGDGYSVLTAAHCVKSGASLATGITVSFQDSNGFLPLAVDLTAVDPAYTGNATLGGDLAVLRLTGQAPVWAARYSLFSGTMPTTSPILLAGYGFSGVGASGTTTGYGTLRAGTNQYVGDGRIVGWSSTILMGQFYDVNNPATKALATPTPYSATDEVMIARGDSGGPSFYNGSIIGVHNLIACVSINGTCAIGPSMSASLNSSFGQIFGDVSVSHNVTWIEAQMVPEPGTFLFGLVGLTTCLLLRRLTGNS